MLGLMQVINYMMSQGYPPSEIETIFVGIANGEATVDDLLCELGLELNPTSLRLAQEKVSKWASAYNVLKMRQAA